MYEIAGTQFEKGVFELRLDKEPPKALAWAVKLGPVRGRLIGLTLLLTSAFLNYATQPKRFLYENGYLTPQIAQGIQDFVAWGIPFIGLALYMFVFFVRRESLSLAFDRTAQEMRYTHVPLGAKNPVKQGSFPFRMIKKIHVHAPSETPTTPHGYIEIETMAPEQDRYNRFNIQLLSDDQFKIYPKNLGDIIGKDPVGAYSAD